MSDCDKDSILKRINEFREYSSISKSALASSIGVEQTTFNNQLLGKRGLSLDTVLALLSTFPSLSAEWLLRGESQMFPEIESDNISAKQAERIEKLIRAIETMQESIDLKNQTIAMLNERIKQLENQLKK